MDYAVYVIFSGPVATRSFTHFPQSFPQAHKPIVRIG